MKQILLMIKILTKILMKFEEGKNMKKKNKFLIILMIIGIILIISVLMGCTKKERYTIDEHGVGKDEWYEPGVPDDTPGFELISILLALVAIVLFRKRRQR